VPNNPEYRNFAEQAAGPSPEDDAFDSISADSTDRWWDVFSGTLHYCVDDAESLLKTEDGALRYRLIHAASTLADDALAEYEKRFTL
jgi:hypothetical protein